VARIRRNLHEARLHLQSAVAKQKQYADQHRTDYEFKVGDLVMLSTENLRLKIPESSTKLQPRWVGPFPIIANISPVVYRLKLPPTLKIFSTFHISRLTPYHSTEEFPQRTTTVQPPPQTVQGEDYWTIEAVVDRRKHSSVTCEIGSV
jgi:hypothetical protein